jgi:hypothetical protein
MPSDPCWLPSAIMQTTGALIGFYLIIYIYGSQRIEYHIDLAKTLIRSNKFERVITRLEAPKEAIKVLEEYESKRRILHDSALYVLLSSGTVTILVNTVWLKFIIDKPNTDFPVLEILSLVFFSWTLITILYYSILTVKDVSKSKRVLEHYQFIEAHKDEIEDILKATGQTKNR